MEVDPIMLEYLLPPIFTVIIYVITLAFGESFFRFLPLDDKRLKEFLVVPVGMFIWPLLALIFPHLLGVGPENFRLILLALSIIAVVTSYRLLRKSISTNMAYLIFIVVMGSLLFLFKIPGNNSISLGDAPEYLQIAKNIVSGLGFKVNFLIADHYNNGMDSIIRPVSNRFPMVPYRLASIGALVGFQSYLINIVVIIMAGNLLNLFSKLCTNNYKKFIFWLMPFFFFMQAISIWGGTIEFETMLYLCAFLYLLLRIETLPPVRGLFLILLLQGWSSLWWNGNKFICFAYGCFVGSFVSYLSEVHSACCQARYYLKALCLLLHLLWFRYLFHRGS